MNQTLKLLRTIGTPFAPQTEMPSNESERLQLYRHAVKNKIPLLYLESLVDHERLYELKQTYTKENVRYLRTLDAMKRVSQLLGEEKIEYAIFKTIKPYKTTTVDIDTLIFKSKNEYKKAIELMVEADYKILGSGPQSTTLYDLEADVGIDIHKEIAVSLISYINKEKLKKHIIERKLPNESYVKTLTLEADLAVIIAHSVIKEHIYTLSEFYTFIYSVAAIKEVECFIKLINENNIISATRNFSTITARLHKVAYKMIPEKLVKILDELGDETPEATTITKKAFKTPHMYSIPTVANSFLEIAKEETVRRNVALQMLFMLKPNFAGNVINKFVDYLRRETY